MAEEASLEFRFKNIDETSDYHLEEKKYNDLISKKYKKTCKYFNYVENLLILVSTVTGCVSISAFPSLVCVPIGIMISAVGLIIWAIITEIKKCKFNYKVNYKENEKEAR